MAVFLAVVGQVEPVLPVQVIRDSKVLDVDGDGVAVVGYETRKRLAGEINREPWGLVVWRDKACSQASDVEACARAWAFT